jgi:hypothetical protein
MRVYQKIMDFLVRQNQHSKEKTRLPIVRPSHARLSLPPRDGSRPTAILRRLA